MKQTCPAEALLPTHLVQSYGNIRAAADAAEARRDPAVTIDQGINGMRNLQVICVSSPISSDNQTPKIPQTGSVWGDSPVCGNVRMRVRVRVTF